MLGNAAEREKKDTRPNVIVILADDMGYSDLGCYGSEISTPNLDALASNGVRFSQFYNAARCCPSRASLLTGVYPHQAGMGAMVRHTDQPNRNEGPYQGYLSKHTVTIAQVLKEAGYYCTMSGKWHVGETHPNWPMDRGFDDYYGLISGAANYFDISRGKKKGIKRHFAKGNEEYMPPKEGFYMTDAITDHAVSSIKKRKGKEQPFFMYLAYTAPHWPLHAHPSDIEKYKDRYKEGWDKLREERYARMQKMGIIDESMSLSPRDAKVPAWKDMTKKDLMALKMAIYAAQVDCMDRNIGRVIQQLKENDQYENTLILFLSDNGGCAETGIHGTDFWKNNATPGDVNSYQSYGRGWANASNTPFCYFKQWVHEGGISTPFIAHWPKRIKQSGKIVRQQAYITDIMATMVDLADAKYPKQYNGEQIVPMHGKSLTPIFDGKKRKGHDLIFWEHFGNMAVIDGNWKLVSQRKEGKGKWSLYNLSTDRAEQHNLANEKPKLAKRLLKEYIRWAKETGVKHQVVEEFKSE
ncbi:arylsulfatase [Prolixibacteraceae bacterium JC049]|nr:arylsulfatase [Prolixibacteraceae bacterium JC049]